MNTRDSLCTLRNYYAPGKHRVLDNDRVEICLSDYRGFYGLCTPRAGNHGPKTEGHRQEDNGSSQLLSPQVICWRTEDREIKKVSGLYCYSRSSSSPRRYSPADPLGQLLIETCCPGHLIPPHGRSNGSKLPFLYALGNDGARRH